MSLTWRQGTADRECQGGAVQVITAHKCGAFLLPIHGHLWVHCLNFQFGSGLVQALVLCLDLDLAFPDLFMFLFHGTR